MIEKLILGTAGLGGLPYGRTGRVVTRDEAVRVIRAAMDAGIRAFDTSPEYGKAEEWLGAEVANTGALVYTKSRGDRSAAIQSMARFPKTDLKILYHNWDHEEIPAWIDGATVYADRFPAAARSGIPILQVDWSLLSQTTCLGWVDKRGYVIARSIFLQGILAGAPVPKKLVKYVNNAECMARALGMTMQEMALRVALGKKFIDRVVIGPTAIAELDDCIDMARRGPVEFDKKFYLLDVDNYELTDPRKWVA